MIKLTDEWISAPCFYWSVIHVNRNRLIHSGLNPPLVSYCFGIFGLMMLSLIETILVTYLMARDDKVKDQSPREDSNQQDESRGGTYDNMDKSFNYRQNDPEMRSTLSTHTIWRQSVIHDVSFQTWRDGLRAIVTCLLTKRYLRHVFHSIISSLSSHSLVHMFLLQLKTKKKLAKGHNCKFSAVCQTNSSQHQNKEPGKSRPASRPNYPHQPVSRPAPISAVWWFGVYPFCEKEHMLLAPHDGRRMNHRISGLWQFVGPRDQSLNDTFSFLLHTCKIIMIQSLNDLNLCNEKHKRSSSVARAVSSNMTTDGPQYLELGQKAHFKWPSSDLELWPFVNLVKI